MQAEETKSREKKAVILFSACSIFPKNHTETAKTPNSVTTISCTDLETQRN